jgi:hypothetical protein
LLSSPPHSFPLEVELISCPHGGVDESSHLGGSGGHDGWSGVSGAGAARGGSADDGSSVEELDELWLSRPSNPAAMLA